MENNIELRKELSRMLKKARANAKPDKCIICGEPQTSFCNSHSVPQMVLKKICDDGELLYINSLVGLEAVNMKKGINNAGTFHFICNTCDGNLFQGYEDAEILKKYPTDTMLAEIALKNVLLMLSKRNEEKALFDIAQKERKGFLNKEILDEIKEMDTKEYLDEMRIYQEIISNKTTGCFQVLCWEKLPYVAPIATKTPITIYKDMNGNVINDVYSEDPNCRMQNLHLCVFPIENETIVLLFHHKREKNYRVLRHQLNSISYEKRLMYINYLIFAYTENYFISKAIKEEIESNENLIKLSKEYNGNPNLGFMEISDFLKKYTPVTMEEIPNFLSEEYSLQGE